MKNQTLQFFYGPGKIRAIVLSDVVALLYERGYPELAKEINKRADGGFKRLDKIIQPWTMANADAQTKAEIEQKVKKAKWKFWE